MKTDKHEYDGQTRKFKTSEIEVGMVLRDTNPDGTSPPFPDMVVVDITYTRNAWNTWTHFHLARPSLFAHNKDAAITVKRSQSMDLEYTRLVLDTKGNPIRMKVG